MFNQQRGLTLVELLVAISVLAIVAVLGWRGLDGIVRARITLTSDLEQTRGMQLTFAQLQSDCMHLASPTILLNHPAVQAKPEQLNLVRTVFSEDQPLRLQVISYQVKEGTLTRRETASTRDLIELDTMWQSAISNTDASSVVTLQSGVSAMAMRLWFVGSNGWSVPFIASTTTQVSPAIAPVTPTGLEVSLQLQGQQTSLLKVFLLGAL
jgi:general secretion pathway protein J